MRQNQVSLTLEQGLCDPPGPVWRRGFHLACNDAATSSLQFLSRGEDGLIGLGHTHYAGSGDVRFWQKRRNEEHACAALRGLGSVRGRSLLLVIIQYCDSQRA